MLILEDGRINQEELYCGLIEPEDPDEIEYVPAEAAAYVRKLVHDAEYDPISEAAWVRKQVRDAKLNDMDNTLPYSHDDIKELFRVKLFDCQNRPDDGMIAVCFFADILAQSHVDNMNSFFGLGRTYPDPDKILQAVTKTLVRFGRNTKEIENCYKTVHQVLNIYMHNQPICEDSPEAFFPKSPKPFSELLSEIFHLCSDLAGDCRDHTPITDAQSFWHTACTVQMEATQYRFQTADISPTFKMDIMLLFHAMLAHYYGQYEQTIFDSRSKKASLLGIAENRLFIDDACLLYTELTGYKMTESEQEKIDAGYNDALDLIEKLKKYGILAGGFFYNLGLLGYVDYAECPKEI